MLGRLGLWRHLVVIGAIGVCAVLALLGIIGGRGERFDAKQITVSPAGGEGVRIREVVDQDFGNLRRHGYERIIPDDFGRPTNVTASSIDADASIDISSPNFRETRIRLGDPDVEFTGQHRYVLAYTLPEAQLSTGVLDLDIIASGEEFETGRFEVIITGFVLADTHCDVGGSRDVGGCTLEPADDDYRVVFTPLREGQGVTVGGTIRAYTDPVEPELPALPGRAADRRVVLALLMIPLGLLGAGVVFAVARSRGRNDVFSGGSVEAAFGRLPEPGGPVASPGRAPMVSISRVADSKMDELATIEFVPPKGLDPWHGAALLTERINDRTIAAWFSALAAADAITLRDDDGDLVIAPGPRREELDPSNAAIVDRFIGGRSELRLGTYDPAFAKAWTSVKQQQVDVIKASGWWKHRPPGIRSGVSPSGLGVFITIGTVAVVIGASFAGEALRVFRPLPLALLFGLIVPTLAAWCVYRTLLPARSAPGSALTLQTESFRRFLAASEGRHVEWAWSQGLLREYSAWAVSLGAADAWGNALRNSNVPPTAMYSSPLLVHTMGSSFASSHTAPSTSGSGGSSGGGGVGGGGGGGSSGSW